MYPVTIRGGRHQAVPIECGVYGATVKNNGPDTVYYRDESPVSSTLNDASLASGATVTLFGAQWFVVDKGTQSLATDSATIFIQELPPTSGGGGGGGGTGNTTVDLDGVPQDLLDIVTTPITPADVGAASATIDGTPVSVLNVSTTVTAADIGALATTARAAANGVASLGSDGKVPSSQLPGGLSGGTETDPVATAALNTHKTDGAAHSALFGAKITTGDPIPWSTITGAPSGLASPRLAIQTSTVTVNTTAIETALVDFTITGADTAVADEYDFEVIGDVLNNTGSTQTLNWKLYWGSLALNTQPQNLPASSSRRPFRMRAKLVLRAATDNLFVAELFVGSAGTMTWPAMQTTTGTVELTYIGQGTSAVDFTADQHAKLTVTPGLSSSSLEVRANGALLNRRRAT